VLAAKWFSASTDTIWDRTRSQAIHCDGCLQKKNKQTGEVTYQHQLLGAVIAHPDYREVIPLAPEPIVQQDGSRKNDCERNAAKRLLGKIRKEHPRLKLIVAFLVDQTQQLCCPLFQAVWNKLGSKRALWDNLRCHFRHFTFHSMKHLYEVMLYDRAKQLPAPIFDTS